MTRRFARTYFKYIQISFQPVLETLKEEQDGLEKIFVGDKHPGMRENVSQLFWLLTSSTEMPSATTVKTTTIQAASSTSTRMTTKQNQIDLPASEKTRGMLTTTGPPDVHTTVATAISQFSLPFLNNPIQPKEESLADSPEEDQLSRPDTGESSSLLATAKEQSSFEIGVESEELGKFEEEIEATAPFTTTTSLPSANLQMLDKSGMSFLNNW